MKKAVLFTLFILSVLASPVWAADLTTTIYERLLADHSSTFEAARWVAVQGKRQPAEVIRILRKMLMEPETVEAFMRGKEFKRADGSTLTNAYPNNAVWALAHIPDQSALDTLQEFFRKDMANGFNRVAGVACTASEIRLREGSDYAVLVEPGRLLKAPGAAEYTPVEPGQVVKILRSDTKGFYYVQIMPVGLAPKGYLPVESPLI